MKIIKTGISRYALAIACSAALLLAAVASAAGAPVPAGGDVRNAYLPGGNIMLTGFWNPTGQMIASYSTNAYLNPGGWEGANWSGSGYDVYSYFPTPNLYNGTFEVDYQKTFSDFWSIAGQLHPVAIISFGAGNGPWEIEYNARNLGSWYDDGNPPGQPTPCPPDSGNATDFVRHSTLPCQAIADAVNGQTSVNAWVDWSGDPGAYLCEYIAYLGMWYQGIHSGPSDPYPCKAAGFIHAVNYLAVQVAKAAVDATLGAVVASLQPGVGEASLPAAAALAVACMFAVIPAARRKD